MVKHTQIICRLLPTNFLSVFDHFMGLTLKRLKCPTGSIVKFQVVWASAATIFFYLVPSQTIETPEHCVRFLLYVISVVLVSLLLTLNRFHVLFLCFHFWFWANKCRLGLWPKNCLYEVVWNSYWHQEKNWD